MEQQATATSARPRHPALARMESDSDEEERPTPGPSSPPRRRERERGPAGVDNANSPSHNDDERDEHMDVEPGDAATTISAENYAGDEGDFEGYVDSDEDSDPDDPIVSSLPVFLTPALTDTLALLQYPHRPPAHHTPHPLLPPSLRPQLDADHGRRQILARYKPRVGHLELSVPLEVQHGQAQKRYNERRARELGRGVQSSDLGESDGQSGRTANGAGASSSNKRRDTMLAYEEGNDTPLQRMTLSGESLPDQTWYAAAVVKDKEVHLTPLTRTIQMRAQLGYLDVIGQISRANAKAEKRNEYAGADDDDDAAGEDDEERGATTAQEVAARKQKREAAASKKKAEDDMKGVYASVKSNNDGSGFGGGGGSGAGGSSDVKTGRAAASLFGPVKAAESEAWVDLPYFDPTTEESNAVYDRLFATKQDKLDMVTKATAYLKL